MRRNAQRICEAEGRSNLIDRARTARFVRRLPGCARNCRGQAAIEFIVCMVVVFFFLLFYLSLCILLVTSEYMDYATFMAARTYKSAYGSEQSQEANARTVFDSYTSKVQGVARQFSLSFIQTQPGDEQTKGVEASYTMDLFYLPPIFVGASGADVPPSVLRLTTESHLGREPGFEDCHNYFEGYVRQLNVPGMDRFIDEMDDNGC